ncbi:5-carboxymethyl-2-hydroxymuconate Delta-isomerase [Deinococcus sp. Leaf326]|uniref:5-carboxymethyl-2-hydroxymuconate Delta-isomerase n=1 Tax=Deinococcus sp. Leaf326 TaxID=1736338 RepID=UPI0006F5CFF4|nr:5-carboxymethyl-2-hydroxymuconate Delta-isomerase [Deinococcus sp. Leaf326]KQR35622.1 5-carboxymethyl-2-hydroxymuconate isomerase [Deinococcus sp. Leaf326]
MPHLTAEYTANLGDDARIPELLEALHSVLIARPDVFPVGGVRTRALRLEEYRVADGEADDAFVHLTLKIGAGRSAEVRQAVGDELFGVLKAHFAETFARRFLALSLEMQEFSEAGTWKHNNIHARFRR